MMPMMRKGSSAFVSCYVHIRDVVEHWEGLDNAFGDETVKERNWGQPSSCGFLVAGGQFLASVLFVQLM